MPCLPSNSSTNPYHTPLFKGMMQRIESKYRAPFYGFANGDILFPPSLVSLLEEVRRRIADHSLYDEVLLVGRRTNYPLDLDVLLPIASAEQSAFVLAAARRGQMFQADAEVGAARCGEP